MVEVTIVVAILSIVSFMLLGFLDHTSSIASRSGNNVRTEQNAQLALRTVSQDLRSATDIAACSGVSYSQCLSFEIPRSQTSTSAPACPESVVTYRLSGTSLLRTKTDYSSACAATVSVNGVPIVSAVQNGTTTPVFTYYDASQTAIDATTQAASIPSAATVVVRVIVTYDSSTSQTLDFSSTVALRNNRDTSS